MPATEWTWGRILTITGDNLRRRGFTFPIVDWCCMCRYSGETMDHLLIHCEKAYQLWCFVLRAFGKSWVFTRKVIDLLFGWKNWVGETLIQHLEFDSDVFDVAYLEGAQQLYF